MGCKPEKGEKMKELKELKKLAEMTKEELIEELAQVRLANEEIPPRELIPMDGGFQVENLMVTVQLYYEVLGRPVPQEKLEKLNHPMTGVSFEEACEWMNQRSTLEGLEPVYKWVDDGEGGERILCARVFANGYRHPSGAEYLQYARGPGNEDPYGPVNEVAHCGASGTCPVGQKKSTEEGVFDPLGNAWEMTV